MPTARQITATYRVGAGGTPPPVVGDVPATQGLVIAGTRPEVKNFSELAAQGLTGMNTEVPHRFPNGTGKRVLLSFDNWGVPNAVLTSAANARAYTFPASYDNACPNPVTYRCSLSETDGSTFYQGHFVRIRHFDGTTTELPSRPTEVTVPGGDSADAVVDLGTTRAAGTWLTSHTYCYVPTGNDYFFRHINVSGTRGEVCTSSAGETDKTMSMISGTKPSVGQQGAWPSAIRHVDAPPSLLRHPTILIGDSLEAGSYGWWEFFKNDTVPYVIVARGTEAASSFLASDSRAQYRRRLASLGGFTRAVVQYLTNDLTTTSLTLSTMQARRSTLVSWASGWGAEKVAVGTLPPTAKSTDAWATTASQSLNMASGQRGGREQARLDYNADLRSGTVYGTVTPSAYLHSLGFYTIDGGGAVEDIGPSANGADVPSTIGRWKVQGSAASTTDGLHPGTAAGRAAWSGAVPDIFFQV